LQADRGADSDVFVIMVVYFAYCHNSVLRFRFSMYYSLVS